jgi:lipid II:glycine glycyltransferase (peptidoglycan interpeptide bridge formation enzyme)
MHSKEKYSEFCSMEDKLPLFFHPWWLDSVCSDGNWDAIVLEKNKVVVGVYPYLVKERLNYFKVLTMPPFTPFLGPYIKYPEDLRGYEKASYEKEVLGNFINELPDFDKFVQLFNYDIRNWLPFYWRDFLQTTYYSYIIEDISDPERIKSEFHPNKQQEIKKAEKIVNVQFDLPPEEFYAFHKKALEKHGQKISYSLDLFRRIHQATKDNNAGRILYATDGDQIYASLFFVWDKRSGYNLITANDPDFRKSGALSLLIYEAISFLSKHTENYDLEGSMNENYEFSYRQFGGKQYQYFLLSKTNSKVFRIFERVYKMFKE